MVRVPWSLQRCGFKGACNAIRDQSKPNQRCVSQHLLQTALSLLSLGEDQVGTLGTQQPSPSLSAQQPARAPAEAQRWLEILHSTAPATPGRHPPLPIEVYQLSHPPLVPRMRCAPKAKAWRPSTASGPQPSTSGTSTSTPRSRSSADCWWWTSRRRRWCRWVSSASQQQQQHESRLVEDELSGLKCKELNGTSACRRLNC